MKPLADDEYEALCCMFCEGSYGGPQEVVDRILARGLGHREPHPAWEHGLVVFNAAVHVAMACYRALHTDSGY